jgi:hypothetical protein
MLFRAWISKPENEALAKEYFDTLLTKLPGKIA